MPFAFFYGLLFAFYDRRAYIRDVVGGVVLFFGVFSVVGDFYDISEYKFFDVFLYDRYEVGYKYLCKIFSLIWNNYQFFQSSISIFQMIAVYYFIKNNSKNYAISTFIFITFETYVFLFGILRQATALAILLFAINEVYNFSFSC